MSDNVVIVERPSHVVVNEQAGVEIIAGGPRGAQGPPGDSGAGTASYVHPQSLPLALWTIVHNLGYFPNVTTVDSANDVVEGDVVYLDVNTVTVEFSAPFSGTAYLS